MRVVVPENVGGDLRVLPTGTYDATIKDIIFGLSQTKQPKATVRYIITSEFEGPKDPNFQSTVGETVLETFSLQEQAMFRVNDLYKQATGSRIPAREYEEEEFQQLLKEALIGTGWSLILEEALGTNGDPRTEVRKRIPAKTLSSSKPAGKGAKK